MRKKLTKYYNKTALPSVYGDGMILDPRLKLYLMTRPEWSGGDTREFSATEYSAACRKRYLENYEKINRETLLLTIPRKRTHRTIDDDDDFETMVSSLPSDVAVNEYDIYINAPKIQEK